MAVAMRSKIILRLQIPIETRLMLFTSFLLPSFIVLFSLKPTVHQYIDENMQYVHQCAKWKKLKGWDLLMKPGILTAYLTANEGFGAKK